MFNSDLDREGPANIGRRIFLTGAAAAAIVGLVFWQWSEPHVLQAAAADANEPKEVTVVLFSDSGQRLNKVTVARVVKTATEWRKQLPSGVFDITRNADTEIAFSGKYWNLHDKGLYRCICCDNALLILLPNSTRALAGLVSGRLLRLRMCARSATQLSAWFVSRFLVPNAMPIWATSSTMAQHPRAFVTA